MKDTKFSTNLPDFAVCPKAIAIDIDGTLLDSRSRLSPRNAHALRKCLTAGIPVIIATSRPARSVRRLLGEAIMNVCSLIMQNGAIGIGRAPLSGRITEVIDRPALLGILDAALKMEPGLRVTLELEGEAFGTNHPREAESLWDINSATPEMQLTLEEALGFQPTKIAMSNHQGGLGHITEMINTRFGDKAAVVGEAGRAFINITAKNASKSNTLKRLLASRNITLENVVAIGDDLPDYDLLAACGTAIAMGNAVPEIKAITRYCTASNDENGVALVLEKILANL